MKRGVSILVIILLLALFSSCEKNHAYDLSPNVNAANDVILAVSFHSTIFNLLMMARLDTVLAATGHSTVFGAVASYDTANREFSFFFNSVDCADSVNRQGWIRMRVSGDILQEGNHAIVTFTDYKEDRGEAGGIDSITNEGFNQQGQLEFSDFVKDSWMVKPWGPGTLHANLSNRYITSPSSFSGGSSITFLVSGTIQGVSSAGYSFTGTIRGSLDDALNCPWIRGGIIDVYVPFAEVTDGYIDFVTGDGCSDTLYYTFSESLFKVIKRKLWLKN